MGRRINGEGTICRRKDGRYEAKVYVPTTSGHPKRVSFYGRTRAEVHERLTEALAQAQKGVPVPERNWRLGDYLDYWLENVIGRNRRPATHEQYEWTIRKYLRPTLGSCHLNRLSVPIVQMFLNQKIAEGHSVRKVHIMRMVLSSALGRAQREELITRNVARLVELPKYEKGEIRPWLADEAKQFLEAAQSDPLYPGFVLLVLFGLRRGEVLGLRWADVDFVKGEIRVRNQVQRVGRQLYQGPVKTKAGQRNLPLLNLVREVLESQWVRQETRRESAGDAWIGGSRDEELVLTTRSGKPIEPRSFVRSFQRICTRRGVRLIK